MWENLIRKICNLHAKYILYEYIALFNTYEVYDICYMVYIQWTVCQQEHECPSVSKNLKIVLKP